ncbi:hypothetical protein BC829DRAFT_406372 [Chytridium lagenaria]|nr:hypothetical protein BC829DRAFT_406372 [Chytridium lagenaria]
MPLIVLTIQVLFSMTRKPPHTVQRPHSPPPETNSKTQNTPNTVPSSHSRDAIFLQTQSSHSSPQLQTSTPFPH